MSAQIFDMRRQPQVAQNIIDLLESMLIRAQCGALKGWIGIADIEGEDPMAVICGSFAEDDDRAIDVAERALDKLLPSGNARARRWKEPKS